MKKISISIGNQQFDAQLNDTPTAAAIYNKLPFKGEGQIWGDEIYFSAPVNVNEEEDAKEEVEVGDLAFWPIGSAFCIFFGKTPMSVNDKPRAASPVNVFGKIEGTPESLRQVKPGSVIRVSKSI
jgi:hypothetical protein